MKSIRFAQNNTLTKISWLFVALWMILIFFLSSQPGEESNQLSTKVTGKIIIHESVQSNNQKNTNWIEEMNTTVRKSTHALVFLVLSMLTANAFYRSGVRGYKAFVFAFLLTAIYAGMDEFHQLFVKGRSGLLSDVGIDCLGGILGLVIFAILKALHLNTKQRISERVGT